MGSRTVIDFQVFEPIWPKVEAWAPDSGFRVIHADESGRRYQKGFGLLVAPMMLEIKTSGQATHIEAWIRINLFTRVMGLFMIPAEMGIESGGFRLVVPRNIARGAVNKLLLALGQPAIQ